MGSNNVIQGFSNLSDRIESRATARVLVVEDTMDFLRLLVNSLDRAGYEVVAAESGDQAMELYEKLGPFDLLLTDVVMPGAVQGIELAAELRSRQPTLRIIFMSGYGAAKVLSKAGVRPEDICLDKPVLRADLIAAVEKSLSAAQ